MYFKHFFRDFIVVHNTYIKKSVTSSSSTHCTKQHESYWNLLSKKSFEVILKNIIRRINVFIRTLNKKKENRIVNVAEFQC